MNVGINKVGLTRIRLKQITIIPIIAWDVTMKFHPIPDKALALSIIENTFP